MPYAIIHMKIKKKLRLLALIVMIFLACLVPFPLRFTSKDNLPKNLIENVEIKDDEEDDDILKEIF
ncbi:hypothetical protein [Winogradskyella flava]|uniref:hypothetical protein n=1 Tax=Winogradskyella flava TaxID=1884876 RepID=UPI002491F929|nr:hypothetical protein [Winogradskyella flava]